MELSTVLALALRVALDGVARGVPRGSELARLAADGPEHSAVAMVAPCPPAGAREAFPVYFLKGSLPW